MPDLGLALALVTDPVILGLIVAGTLGGVLVGALPGLSSSMAVALLLPFSLYLEPVPAIALLSALYCAGTFGGSITAILINARRCCTARSKSLTSLCRLQSHPAQYVSGIPSAAILLSISHPIRCSTRCLANVRARISGPMIAL